MTIWLGMGIASDGFAPLLEVDPNADAPPSLTPSADWTGLAGSGFASVPVDSARTTAKPALRLITPPFQWFTDTIDVGVMAAANDGGTLRDTLGVDGVTFHYEGATATVDAPKWHSIETERGTKIYYGWWVRLKKPIGIVGHGHLYVEAAPRDATMQSRVIGPYTFSPQDTLHDIELPIAPSQPFVAGESYPALTGAINYCKANGFKNPKLTITEAGTYNFGTGAGELYTNEGYVTVEASVPGVVIGRTAAASSGATNMLNDRSKIRFKGSNLTLDFRYCLILEQSASNPTSVAELSHWFDGVNITTSDPEGVNSDFNDNGAPRSVLTARLINGQSWFTEAEVDGLHNAMIGAQLIRGCNAEYLGADVSNSAKCIVQSRFFDNDNTFWNDDRPAFDVQYTGSEPTATIARTGGVLGTSGGVWFVNVNGTVSTFNSGRAAFFTGGDGRFFSDLVAWLNTLPDITATLRIAPFDRVASSGSLAGLVGQGFGATDIKTAPLEVVSNCDIHADFYQHPAGGDLDNVLIAFNEVVDYAAQILFLSPPNPAPRDERDVLIFGNIFEDKSALAAENIGGSQWGRSNLPLSASHVVITHNSFVNQQLLIRNEGGGLNADSYCLLKNNSLPELDILGTSPVPNLTIDGLHLQVGGSAPVGATNVTIGGDETTLFADAANYDFAPAGELLANPVTAALPVDRHRKVLAANGQNGALG
uniref:hypothetical protein n=1 Tax=uncultured Erythrobacter sp. TaxID=263913 RepID=UPI002626CF14|nr:hypothetical protein [uncultured Erythrobacter sp.]